MDRLLELDTGPETKPRHKRYTPQPDGNSHCPRFDDHDLLDELDCPVYTSNYDTMPLLSTPPVEPTLNNGAVPPQPFNT